MEEFLSKLQQFLATPAATRVLAIGVAVSIGVAGWGLYQYQQETQPVTENEQRSSLYSDNNRITSHIPHRTPFYSISYDRNGTDPVTIKVFTDSPYYRSEAIRYLQRHDQEVTINHPIEFVDYTSPLKEGS